MGTIREITVNGGTYKICVDVEQFQKKLAQSLKDGKVQISGDTDLELQTNFETEAKKLTFTLQEIIDLAKDKIVTNTDKISPVNDGSKQGTTAFNPANFVSDVIEQIKKQDEPTRNLFFALQTLQAEGIIKTPPPLNPAPQTFKPPAIHGTFDVQLTDDWKFDKTKVENKTIDNKYTVTNFSDKKVTIKVLEDIPAGAVLELDVVNKDGKAAKVKVTFANEEAPPGSNVNDSDEPNAWQKWVGVLVGVGGGLLLAAGVGFTKFKEEMGGWLTSLVGLGVAVFAGLDWLYGLTGLFGVKKDQADSQTQQAPAQEPAPAGAKQN